ncbi:hypothetical protein BZZ01_20230 [Nostocales cyanobacterium HT-58-2]|nr:hypothetical protein BZZ01_20230 [Nostocales cyanobacterium HT-58-2]
MINGSEISSSNLVIGQLLASGSVLTSPNLVIGELLANGFITSFSDCSIGYLIGSGFLFTSPNFFQGIIPYQGFITQSENPLLASLFSQGNLWSESNYQNYLLAIQACFGINVYQNIDFVIIQKSDLPSLTPNYNNRAEQLLTAIFLQMLSNYKVSSMTDKFEIFQWKSLIEQNQVKHLFVIQERQSIGDKV